MSVSFIPTEKYLDIAALSLKPKTSLIVLEGTIRSSKTEIAKPTFLFNVIDNEEELHLISAYDLDAINDNILDGEHGLLNQFPDLLKLQKDTIGGYYVSVKCVVPMKYPREKKILLAGYASANKWKKILGKTMGVILIDEVNTANKQFVDECFARQTSAKKPLQIWTLNGDNPQKWVYSDYINRCKILKSYRDKVPASIRADMDKIPKETGWYYFHFTMLDNPIMTKEKIDRAVRVYPVGSFYYTIKILGERCTPNKLIYLDYFNPRLFKKIIDKPTHEITNESEVSIRDFNRFIVGCDIGATKALNSFTLTGFTHDFYKIAFVDKHSFKNVGYNDKKINLIQFIKKWLERGINIELISIDSAEANFIRDLQTEFKTLNLPTVISSYKATIKERIDAMIILASAERVYFNDTFEGRDLYDAFMQATWVAGKEGQEREDLNEPHNDKIDSAEYSFTRYMKTLLLTER